MGLGKRTIVDLLKNNIALTVTPLLIVIGILTFSDPLHRIVGEENYVVTHLMMVFFIVVVSATITIQAWMFFSHTLSFHRLLLGTLFLTVTIIEMFHAITYKGMPFFFVDSSSYHATWFYMINRFILAVAPLVLVLSKERIVSRYSMWVAYGLALLYSVIWIALIYFPVPLLPDLVVDGLGTTTLKNNLQWTALFIQLTGVLLTFKKYRLSTPFYNMVLIASFYLILSDVFYTAYSSVYDVQNFIGHIFQIVAAYALLKALYFSSIQEPFNKRKQIEEELKENERFLHTVTTNMGEGLIVCDNVGKLTFMNEEAEKILKWPKEDLLGKNIFTYVFKTEDCSKTRFQLMNSEKRKIEEDWFIRKDGTKIPVSYSLTPYTEKDRQAGVILVFRNISEQIKQKDLINYLAFHDELTKLPNSRFFNEQLQKAILQHANKKLAVLLIDINRFKHVNDSLGHTFGDNVLIAFSKKLREVIDKDILISRYKGDEFTILLSPLEHEDEIRRTCQRIQTSFNEPLQVQDIHFTVSVNFGVSIYPEHGRESEDLVKNANIAMLQALENNETYFMFHSSMAKDLQEQLELENDLHQALLNNELFLVYQPQVNIETLEVLGFEVLLRWDHPTRGLISPGKFIPIAEETGLIVPIGEWVLREACKQLKQWHDQGYSNLKVSVNLSARQLYQENLSCLVSDILNKHDLLPSDLELEITESMTMINIKHSLSILQRLKEIGVRIAVDDFGTGYSSLSYLKHLPFDRVKIDQSFVKDFVSNEDTSAIVSMIVSMAHHLNMEVIAEGVETLEQLKQLRNIKCVKIQGYLFKEPIKPEQVPNELEWLEAKIKRILTEELQTI